MSGIHPDYLQDVSGLKGYADRLAIPASEEELSDLLAEADASRTPVTISGAGTGITGGRVPQGGWIVSLEKFTHMEVKPGYAVCGAAVRLGDLHAAAARSGQFYPPDPTETLAFVGGNVACNSSGSRSFRYGDTRRYVNALRVVLADGSVRSCRQGEKVDFEVPALPLPATTKFSAGYRLKPGMDWVDLFIGSEGTLGAITEVELRLVPARGDLLNAVVFFPENDAALEAVESWRGIAGLAMLEYLDGNSLDLMRAQYPEIPKNTGAALIIEHEAGDDEIEGWIERLEATGADGEGSWFAMGEQDRERFRRFRHALAEIVNDTVRRNGFMKVNSDYAVPVARNAEMLAFYRRRLTEEFPGQFVIYGHIGDAHVHINILPTSADQFARAKELMVEFAREAVRLGGCVGAEHGLGKRKAHLLALQYTPRQIEQMKAVKSRLDPNWILCPGNLFP